jgi:hypothetical protein
MPYSLTVSAYSNLRLDASLRQDSFAPGAKIHLTASLWEYEVPLRGEAVVRADVLQPDGSRATLGFVPSGEGTYRADWATSRPGVYAFTVRAEGNTSSNGRFQREKVLTAGVWAGGDQTSGSAGDGDCCAWLRCLLERAERSGRLQEHLKTLGVAALASAPSEDTPLLKSAETQPVVRKPKREPMVGNLFVLPGSHEEEPPSPKGKSKKSR